MHKIYGLKYLRYEKFDGILRASRPRTLVPIAVSLITLQGFLPDATYSMRVGFIQSPVHPACCLAVAGGSTPTNLTLSGGKKA